MPSILALLSTHSGVGQTTLALNLARAFMEENLNVLLVDTDTQAIVRDWMLYDDDGELPAVISIDHPKVLQQYLPTLSQGFDVTIVDAGSQMRERLQPALAMADFALVVTPPCPADLWTLAEVAERVQAVQEATGAPEAAFLVARDHAPTRHELLDHSLDHFDLPVLETRISHDPLYAEALASGRTVLDLAPESDAADEVRALSQNLLGRLDAQASAWHTMRDLIDR